MSPPLFPCPKKFTFWDTTLLPEGEKAASAAEKPAPPPPKKAKAVRHTKARRKG